MSPTVAPTLADLTTLGVGGPVGTLHDAVTTEHIAEILRREGPARVAILGQGSNVLASDEGWPGPVLRLRDRSLRWEEDDGGARVWVGGGLPWDDLVAASVARGLSGIAELSGIPGTVGAAPVQNIGAYGREVGEILDAVRVLDRTTGQVHEWARHELEFGYRSSPWKGPWRGRDLILAVALRLPRAPSDARHGELRNLLGAGPQAPQRVRAAVLDLRRRKGMLLLPDEENRRSAGSFFLNPSVPDPVAEDVERSARTLVAERLPMPRWPAGPGATKLSAAWLIESAGFPPGWGSGPAGLSTRHALAVVNRGMARAQDIVDVALTVRDGVWARFRVRLEPEVERLGFRVDPFAAAPG